MFVICLAVAIPISSELKMGLQITEDASVYWRSRPYGHTACYIRALISHKPETCLADTYSIGKIHPCLTVSAVGTGNCTDAPDYVDTKAINRLSYIAEAFVVRVQMKSSLTHGALHGQGR